MPCTYPGVKSQGSTMHAVKQMDCADGDMASLHTADCWVDCNACRNKCQSLLKLSDSHDILVICIQLWCN